MKKLLNFIFIIGTFLFFFIEDVKAEEEIFNPPIIYNSIFGTYIDSPVFYKDLGSDNIFYSSSRYNGTVSSSFYEYLWNGSTIGNYVTSDKGLGISSCSSSFVENNYYSITAYYVVFANPDLFYVHNSYAIGNNKIGLGPSESTALNNMSIVPTDFYRSIDSVKIPGKTSLGLEAYLMFNTIVFKADKNASCVSWAVNKNGGGLTSSNFDYVGYRISYQGTEPPSNDEVTSFITQESNKINQNIDSMKEKQDKTNELIESEDDDTTSKKCGMLCKLKGIFTGIIELPGKLVELLVNALKSLFVPTDDQLYDIVNESKELTDNFGFVGESVNFFLTIFTSLLGLVNANGCVELPEFTIGATSLFESYTFWQAQNVCLGDNAILSANINTIRTITSIVLVSLFINFAARKFFNILSKNDNDQARTDAYDIK